jgi:cell division protease FtsH
MSLGHNDSSQVFLGRDFSSHPDYSDTIAFEIDKEVRRLIDESYEEARQILVQYRTNLDKIVDALLEQETIEKDALTALLQGVEKRPPRETNGSRAALSLSPTPRKSSRARDPKNVQPPK